jgi:hypothetical protein
MAPLFERASVQKMERGLGDTEALLAALVRLEARNGPKRSEKVQGRTFSESCQAAA